MAITKTTDIVSIYVNYQEDPAPVQVTYEIRWDDPDDDELPLIKADHRTIRKMTETMGIDENGDPITNEVPTDYSGEDARVIAICDAVWS